MTNPQKSVVLCLTHPDNARRNPGNNRPSWNIPRHHRPRPNHSTFTDAHTSENDSVGTDPDIPPDTNPLRITALITDRVMPFKPMLIGNNPRTRPNQRAMTDFNTTSSIYYAEIINFDTIADPDATTLNRHSD
jgi:hypothetical protein